MIQNHQWFLRAIHEKKKVRVRRYAVAGRTVDRVCAPMDYGPGPGQVDGVNRYWLWDYTGDATFQALALLPHEIVELQMLGEVFDPAQFAGQDGEWFTPRDWSSKS